MGRKSIKEDKKPYQIARENLKLTREAAAELLEWISADRLERIDNREGKPNPEEVLRMAEVYKEPELWNYYCSHDCPIGQKYVPEIKVKNIECIVLELLDRLGDVEESKEKLIEITADGIVTDNEVNDLREINDKLEKISITVETLQLWVEKQLPQLEEKAKTQKKKVNKK